MGAFMHIFLLTAGVDRRLHHFRGIDTQGQVMLVLSVRRCVMMAYRNISWTCTRILSVSNYVLDDDFLFSQ